MKRFVPLLAILLLVTACSDLPSAPGQPGSINGGNIFGFASGGVFGDTGDRVAYTPQTLNFDATQNTITMQINASDTVIYNTGYTTKDGTDWQPFTLSGDTQISNWLLTRGTGQVTFNADGWTDNQGAFVVYTCTWEGQWNCHGGVWQRETFDVNVFSCADDQCVASQTCYNASDVHPTNDQICLSGEWRNFPSGPSGGVS
jgi:hypothetical protein